jgi:uncharacterized cupredoxin-like copper-binding protein
VARTARADDVVTGVGRARSIPAAPPTASRRAAAALALLAAVLVTALGYAVDAAAAGRTADVLGPGLVTVTLEVEHSRFSSEELRVRAGTVVEFVVVNHDPIHHELIVGPPEVHERHARGTESVHPPIPGEVSVGPNRTASTFYRFDEPGTVDFACHLPGHLDYGMVGRVEVLE